MRTTIIILLFIYILSVWKVFCWTRKAYNKNGRWSWSSPNGSDIVMLFCPIINSIISIFYLFMNPLDSEKYPSYLEKLAKQIFKSK